MNTKSIRLVVAALLLLGVAGWAGRARDEGTSAAKRSGVPSGTILTAPESACTPTDQDQYVWRASRLQTLQPCIRATGTVVEVHISPDGDMHLSLRVDAASETLLNAGNSHNEGNLIIEAVCQFPPPAAEVLRICASDPDPYDQPFPRPGDHVWMEGRYVLDLQHYAWAELHPLYRWGAIHP